VLRLQIEEEALPPEPAAVAGQVAVLADHSVAGDDDGDAVVPVGPGDGSHGLWTANLCCLLLVGPRLSVWDLPQALPDLLLEWCARRDQWEMELLSAPGEVCLELSLQRIDVWMLAGEDVSLEPLAKAGDLRLEHSPIGKLKQADAIIGRAGEHEAEGGKGFGRR